MTISPLEQRIAQEDIPPQIKRILNQLVRIGVSDLRGNAQGIRVYFAKEGEFYCAHLSYCIPNEEKREGYVSIGVMKK